jgi:hypothetical protein
LHQDFSCRSGSDRVVLRIVSAGEILMQTIRCDTLTTNANLVANGAAAGFTYADMEQALFTDEAAYNQNAQTPGILDDPLKFKYQLS